jgi:alkylphosphonate utilization operon protein PhnA
MCLLCETPDTSILNLNDNHRDRLNALVGTEPTEFLALCPSCFGPCSMFLNTDSTPTSYEEFWQKMRPVLSQSMWSERTPSKLFTWYLLSALTGIADATNLLNEIYLNDDEQSAVDRFLAKYSGSDSKAAANADDAKTVDSNGAEIKEGDSVVLIKDLDVKGMRFTAKRGTLVNNIRLTPNPEQVEGKVNGTVIVLLTKYLRLRGVE